MKLVKVGNFKQQQYKDFHIMAHENLHSDMMNVMKKYLPEGKDLLGFDVAAGEGAFTTRISDHGYKIEASDIDADNFKAKNIPFFKLDLNSEKELKEFVADHKHFYDFAVSLETIEHIENPWMFVRFLKDIVKPGGYIFISTPNTESIFSRISFLLNAKFHQFYEFDLSYGHINPMTSFHMKVIFNKENLNLVKILPVGAYPLIHVRNKILYSLGWSIGNLLLYPLIKEPKTGWALCYIIKT